jgi:thiol-disulfide isomerase/thioredoxin
MSEKTSGQSCFPFVPWVIPFALALALVLAGLSDPGSTARAAEPAAGGAGFRTLLDQRQRETLQAVADYIAKNPQADDVEQAYLWMFETAGTSGLEAEVVPQAEQFLARRDLEPSARQLAQSTLCVGLARKGKLEEGVAQFGGYLMGARFQSPFRTLDLASSLTAQARIAGNINASREIYERVASAYPFNAQVTEIIEGRIARQEQIGKPAPPVVVSDIQGKPFDLAALAGQVVLVDFWATNCAPCLAEFPNLRQLYKEYGSRGFEIVGVSFDENAETVETYRTRAKLPWRMVMNESPQGKISERFLTRTIPALFLIDKQGKIAQVDVRGTDLRTVVERLLK